jgi:hypothetical protein
MQTIVGFNTTSWLDTGAVTPSGALPSATSDRGATNGITFRNNTIRQGPANNTGNIANVVANHTNVANANQFYGNQVPQNAALAMGPFIDSTIQYTSIATLTIDASLVPPRGCVQILLGATANTTCTISNATIGQIITFEWVQDATGSRTFVNPTNLKLSSTAWTHLTTASKRDTVTARYDGTNWNEIARALVVG